MNADHERRIDALFFEAAVEIDDDSDRRLFLESACGANPARLTRLIDLLRLHDQSESEFAKLVEARDLFLTEIVSNRPAKGKSMNQQDRFPAIGPS